jgi:hypothetical protein
VHLFSLFLEQNVLFFAHLRVPKNILVDEVVGLEGSFEGETIVMLEYASAFHSVLLPSAIIAVTIFPHHLSMFMISSIFEPALVDKLTRNCQFSLPVFLITIPRSLNNKLPTSYLAGWFSAEEG